MVGSEELVCEESAIVLGSKQRFLGEGSEALADGRSTLHLKRLMRDYLSLAWRALDDRDGQNFSWEDSFLVKKEMNLLDHTCTLILVRVTLACYCNI